MTLMVKNLYYIQTLKLIHFNSRLLFSSFTITKDLCLIVSIVERWALQRAALR